MVMNFRRRTDIDTDSTKIRVVVVQSAYKQMWLRYSYLMVMQRFRFILKSNLLKHNVSGIFTEAC